MIGTEAPTTGCKLSSHPQPRPGRGGRANEKKYLKVTSEFTKARQLQFVGQNTEGEVAVLKQREWRGMEKEGKKGEENGLWPSAESALKILAK